MPNAHTLAGSAEPASRRLPRDDDRQCGMSEWARMRADASAKMDDVKAKIDNRARQLDAAGAATDADIAEVDASAALDFADWAVGNAKLAVLDARAYADDRAKIANA
jgi:hypothetical protein